MSDKFSWEEMIDRHLRGELNEAEKERLAEWLDSDTAARREFVEQVRWDTEMSEALREGKHAICDEEVLTARRSATNESQWTKLAVLQTLLAAASLVIVALSVGLFVQSSSEPPAASQRTGTPSFRPAPAIARISGLSGALVWTGDRGQVERQLSVGSQLDGGTIEGEAPDSWFELKFNDGSTAMIAGTSILTFSDFGQKQLHLKKGNLSASVVPQPAGKPMLIHTRSAVLKVLGTRFEVEAEMDSTALHVSEGQVQVRRLSDGRTIEVPARHRVVTSFDGDLSAAPIPDVEHDWKSRLHLGPTDLYGKWRPPTPDRPASLQAIPFVPQENQSVTLHLFGLPVNRADNSPVVVQSGSRFLVRGRLEVAADVFFGIRVARSNGEFAGKFLARQPAKSFNSDSDFEAVFHLDQFGLDPCVWDRKHELPSKPDDLVLTGVWAFTHTGSPTGLEVTEVELVPPGERDERREPLKDIHVEVNNPEEDPK